MLAEAGVVMVAASEAHEAAQVGQWRYAESLQGELADWVAPETAAVD